MDGVGKIYRDGKWREHLAAWKSSGLSQAAYCRQHGLTQNDFSWWKRKIAQRDQSAAVAAPTFVPVNIAHLPGSPCYAFELSLRGGRVLRFDVGIDPAALGRIVKVLERQLPC